MIENNRKTIIKQIEDKRGTRVITLITSDRPNLNSHIDQDMIPILHEHLREISNYGPNKIDLFISSRGGNSDVPWTIVSMMREYCKEGEFSVLIPFHCHSAATMIALGADLIIMGRKGELGPIDITMRGPHNPKNGNSGLPISVEDVMGYFQLHNRVNIKNIFRNSDKPFELISQKVNPLALGSVHRLHEQTSLAALRLLETRSTPYKKSHNEKIIKTFSSEIFSHGHTISRSEAQRFLNLKHCVNAEVHNIEEDIWNLFEEYNKIFDFNSPFNSSDILMSQNLDTHDYKNMPLAIIESRNLESRLTKCIKVKTIRETPPTLNINLQGISIPPVNIGNLPNGYTIQQVNDLVVNTINNIVQNQLNTTLTRIVDDFYLKLPIKGFQTNDYDIKWSKI